MNLEICKHIMMKKLDNIYTLLPKGKGWEAYTTDEHTVMENRK